MSIGISTISISQAMVCQCFDWCEYIMYDDVEYAKLCTIYTNYSLRATSASRLFAKNVPKNIIQGHRSLASPRAYELTSAEQNCAVTKVIKSQHAMFSDESTPGPSTRNQLEDDVKPDITESNKEN